MRPVRVGLAILTAVTFAACASVPSGDGQGPPAELPTYIIGQKWIRSDGVYELVRVEDNLYIFISEYGREIHLTKELALARIGRPGDFQLEFDPPPRLTWPLEVGKWGGSSLIVRGWNLPLAPTTVNFVWSVEAYEDVRVPAGTFKAFKIVQEIADPRTGGATRKFISWYAPDIRQFVQLDSRDIKLLTYSVIAVDWPVSTPLQVTIDWPPDQAHSLPQKLLASGKVTAGKGVAKFTVSLNDREISKEEEKTAAKKEIAFNIPIQLTEGRNVLLVTAADAGGDTHQEARVLFYSKPGTLMSLDAPPLGAVPTTPDPTTPPIPTPSVSTVGKPEAPREPGAPGIMHKPSPPPTPTEVAALPPLVVTLSSPHDQARVEQESIGLAGLISGAKGVSRVVVTLNSMEVSRVEEKSPQLAVPVNLPLKLREGQNTLVVTVTEVDGAVHQEVRTIYYEPRVPLTVTFRFPEDRARMTDEASVVAAVVTSSKGIAKVSVTLNETEVHLQTERTPQKSLVVAVPVKLRVGPNVIGVSASEPDGTVRQEVRTVIFDKPKVALPMPAPRPAPPTRDNWAVVVGVGRYESQDIPRLRYAVPDAEAIYQVLTGPAGFKPEHVFLLTDKTERKPTLRNVKWALGTFLARSAKKDDTVLIFFAGHGAPEVDQRGLERDGLAKYLVPLDADPDDLYSTALPMDELQTIFGRIEAERVVVFLDACYSGAAGGRTFASGKTRALNVDDLFLERLTRAKGRAVLTASRASEVSLELPELGHGIFTYYLVQGLKGAADLNRDGIVSLHELYEYVEQQVTQKSRAVGGNQHPVMKGELEGVLPLVKVK